MRQNTSILIALGCLLLSSPAVAQEPENDPVSKWEKAVAESKSEPDQEQQLKYLSSIACEEASNAQRELESRREKVKELIGKTFEALGRQRTEAVELASALGSAAGEANLASENFGYWVALCVEYERLSEQ